MCLGTSCRRIKGGEIMVSTQMVNFTVNGDQVSLPAKPGQSLAKLLREELRLTGTKIGCSEAECGSCTVVIEGKPTLSLCLSRTSS